MLLLRACVRFTVDTVSCVGLVRKAVSFDCCCANMQQDIIGPLAQAAALLLSARSRWDVSIHDAADPLKRMVSSMVSRVELCV